MGLGPRDEDGLTDVPQMRPWLIKREDTPNVQVPTLLFFPFGRGIIIGHFAGNPPSQIVGGMEGCRHPKAQLG